MCPARDESISVSKGLDRRGRVSGRSGRITAGAQPGGEQWKVSGPSVRPAFMARLSGPVLRARSLRARSLWPGRAATDVVGIVGVVAGVLGGGSLLSISAVCVQGIMPRRDDFFVVHDCETHFIRHQPPTKAPQSSAMAPQTIPGEPKVDGHRKSMVELLARVPEWQLIRRSGPAGPLVSGCASASKCGLTRFVRDGV
jgi:hypothetical protein